MCNKKLKTLSLVTGGFLLASSYALASNVGHAEERIIPTGKYYSQQFDCEFNYAETKVVDAGKTLRINGFDHRWFTVNEDATTGDIIDPIKEVLKDPAITKVYVDSRRTLIYVWRQLAQLMIANPSIKSIEIPTFVGHQPRMEGLKKEFLDYFQEAHGLTCIVGEGCSDSGKVQLTFVIP